MGVGDIDDRARGGRSREHIPPRPMRAGTRRARTRGPAPARALPPRRRSGRARGARRALPAARAPARAPLPARRRAARRPRPGRLARPAEGDRPLRPRARDRVLVLRGPDDPRRAQAPLPRQGLVGPRPARPAGARRAASTASARSSRRELGRAPTPAEIAERTGATPEQVLEAREAAGAYRAVSLDRPRDDDEEGERHRRRRIGIEDPGFGVAEDAATVERLMRVLSEREREVLRLRFAEDLTQSEIGERVGVSQMHVSRLIRQAIARCARPRTRARRAPGRRRTGLAGAMEHWDLRTLDVEPHQPEILHSARGEARSIADRAARGRGAPGPRGPRARLSRRRDRRRGRGSRGRPAGRASPPSSTPASATPCAPVPMRGCCSCSRRGRETDILAHATRIRPATRRHHPEGEEGTMAEIQLQGV